MQLNCKKLSPLADSDKYASKITAMVMMVIGGVTQLFRRNNQPLRQAVNHPIHRVVVDMTL